MHELSLRPLVVVYGTRIDLDQAIASRSYPGNREHLLWTLDTLPAEADGKFVHELTHIFAFDIVPVSVLRDVPSWLQEGLAEFQRGEWADTDIEVVRELLRANTFPALGGLPLDNSENTARLHKIAGHLAIDFLVAREGQDALTPLLRSLRDSVASPLEAFLSAAGISEREFDREFAGYVRMRFGG